RRLRWVEDVRDQAVRAAKAVDPIIDESDQDALPVLTAVLRRGVDLGQIGAVGKLPHLRQNQLQLRPPDQLRSRGNCLLPQRITEKVPIRQTEHVPAQLSQDATCDRGLAYVVPVHLSPEEHVRAVLDESHYPCLGI